MTTPPTRSKGASNGSRRDFLATTTAAVGAAAFFGAGAGPQRQERWGKAPASRPRIPLGDGETIRIGVIGPGGMGSAHCRSIMGLAEGGHEKVQIVALSDVCDERLYGNQKSCAERQGIDVAAHPNYVELLERDDIHGVLIASPEHWHGQMSRDAITCGKDIYVEKPMTLRLDDALHLREVLQSHPGTIFQVGTQKMMLPKYIEAQRLIAEGAIGKPTSSQTSYCRNSMNGEWLYYGINPEWKPGVNLNWDAWCGPLGKAAWDPEIYARWRRYRKYSTGIIGDLLVHQITPLMMALDVGWPTQVHASAGHYIDKEMENHDQINISAEFEKEHTMIVAGSTCNEVGLETLIRGHKANLYLGGRHVELRPERIFSDDVDPQKIECPDIGNDQDKLRLNWLECMRTRKPAISGIDHATKVMVIVDLATRSAWDGAAYAFDSSTMTATRL